MENSVSNFKFYLQQELVGRCRTNPKYSLRAFAKSLGVVPSALSDMLNGKRAITQATIEKFGLALRLSPQQIQGFKSVQSKKTTSSEDLKFQFLREDIFALISEWYHFAILELMKVKGFKPAPAWIAKALGLTRSEVNVAVERLARLELIEIKANGSWVDTSDGFSTNIEGGKTNAAAQYLQRTILEQSIRALSEVPLQLRDHTSMTMAIDPKDVPTAVERIKAFRRNLCRDLEKNSKPKEVYQLSISIFPITQIQKTLGGENEN